MFTGHSQKKVPKTLNECIKPDGVSSNLWILAERLEKWGSILLSLIIVFGIINTIFTGVSTYHEIDYNRNGDGAARETVFAVITSLFTCAILAFLEYCAYRAVALLIGSLASIVQNTNISANLALYSVKGKAGDKFTEESENAEGKKEIVEGEETDDEKTNTETKGVGKEENYIDIKCPHCGQELSFTENTHSAICPWCNNSFDF